MSSATGVAVVVCAYTTDRLPQLRRALRSVDEQRPRPARTILVVDHNPQLLEACQRLQALEGPADLQVVASTGPPGLSGARNTGVALNDQPVVAFLDDDAVARPGWVAGMQARFLDPRVQAVGGRAVPVWEGARPTWFPPEFDWVVGCSHRGMPDAATPIRNIIGCNMAFRADALVAIGGFNPAVGRTATTLLGAEETEVCIRIRAGHGPESVVFDPALVVDHAVPAPRQRFGYFVRRCHGEGRSKARMVGSVGRQEGLSRETDYVRRTIPRGVLEGLASPRGWRSGGPARAAAMVAGVGVAAAGFLTERGRAS